jgi:prophage regulatory protein
MYLTDEQVAARYTISRMTVWRWAREGRLPRPVKLGPNVTRWVQAELEANEAELHAQRENPVQAGAEKRAGT